MKTTRTKRLGPRVVGVRAAKAQLSRLLQDVQDGGEWTITNRGKPIARLVPIGHGALSVGERIHRLEENGIIEPARAGRFPLPPPLPLKTGFAQKICWTKIAIPAREADHRSTQRIGTHPLFGRRSFAMRTVGVPLNTRAAKASILKHRERVLPPGLLHSTAGRTRRGPPADAATAVGARWTLANAADVSEPGQALSCRPRGSRAQQRARREISGSPATQEKAPFASGGRLRNNTGRASSFTKTPALAQTSRAASPRRCHRLPEPGRAVPRARSSLRADR